MAMATSEYAWTFYIQGSQNFMMFVNCLQLQWKAGNHNNYLFCEYFRPLGRIKHWQSKFLRTASASAVLLMTLNKFGLIVKPSTSDITYRFHQGKGPFWSQFMVFSFSRCDVLIFFVHLNNACLTTYISIRSQRENAKIYEKKNVISRSIARIDEKTF